MSKLIIYCTGKPMIHGFKRREFTWSAEHNCYLFRGKEFEPKEFNEVVEKALRNNSDMYPLVRAIIPAPVAAAEPVPPPVAPAAGKKTPPKPAMMEV